MSMLQILIKILLKVIFLWFGSFKISMACHSRVAGL